MKGLMQDAPLMISSLIQNGADVYGGSEVVSVVAGEGVVRHTYKSVNQRAKRPRVSRLVPLHARYCQK